MNEYGETECRVENIDDQDGIYLLKDEFRVSRVQTA